MGNCKKNKKCGCNEPTENLCQPQPCGCKFEVPFECVRVNKELPCVGTTAGRTLEDVLTEVDDKLCNVQDGVDGLSAYEVAVGQGFGGTEEEWLESLECSCESTYFYEEIQEISGEENVGDWTDLTDPTTVTPVIIPSFTYNIPLDGDYEVVLNAVHIVTNDSNNGIYVDLTVDDVLQPNAIAIESNNNNSAPFRSITLAAVSQGLNSGQVVKIRVASTSVTNSKLLFVKYQIKKL